MAKADETQNVNANVVTNEELEAAKVALDEANAEKEELLKQIEELNKAKEEKEALEKEIEELKKANENNPHAPKKGSFIVKAPVEHFNGEVAGVQFAYGQAVVQPGWVLEWFKEKGFEVEEVK